MQVTIRQIATATVGLNELSRKEMPIKTSFAIARNLKQIQEEQQLFEQQRTKLFKEYGSPVVNGQPGQYQVDPDKVEEFQKAQNELLECTVDIDVTTLKVDDLERAGINLKPETIVTLGFMFEGMDG